MEPLSPHDPLTVGRYRLLGRLGSGGMGVVYLGQSPGGRLVAVKCVHRELAGDAEFRRRFARESAAARLVGGFHTAPVVDADPEGDPPWLVTAYIPGLTLAEAVAAAGGALPEATVRALGAGLAEALEAIHSTGLVHRDLKPSNVLITDDGPRVIDFGIARALDDTALTRSQMMMGTPGFSSPEQLTGAQVGPASDVFCLGLVLCHAGGVPPFGRGNHEALLYRIVHQEAEVGGVPEDMREVVGRCLAKDPETRPSAAELLERWTTTPVQATAWLPEAVATRVAAAAHGAPEVTAAGTPTPQQVAAPTEQATPNPVAGSNPSHRRTGVLAAVTVIALAAAGTGLYFGLHGSGGNPSNEGHGSASPAGPGGRSSTSSSSARAAAANSSAPAAAVSCASGTLAGSGSAVQANVLGQIVKDYQAACPGAVINYSPTGSGAGLAAFNAEQNDFAVVDSPLIAGQQGPADARCGNKALSVAASSGAVWVVANVPGVASGLNLSASTVAKIFNGKVTVWDDPAIVHDNPGVALPDAVIQPIHRSDASTVSDDFSTYLHLAASGDFAQEPDKTWPGSGGVGFSGATGVAAAVRSTNGGIAYLDAATAEANGFHAVSLDGVAPSATTVASFLARADIDQGYYGDVVLKLPYTHVGDGRYPAVSVAYVVVCKTANDFSKLPLLKGFLGFLVSRAEQDKLADLGYAGLPVEVQAKSAAVFAGLT